MADIQTDITPTVRRVQFAGKRDPQGYNPFARQIFNVEASAIAAKIATNTGTVTVTCSLPADYAYAFEFISSSIRIDASIVGDSDSVENYEDNAEALLYIDGVAANSNRLYMPHYSRGAHNTVDNARSRKEWVIDQPYKSVFFNDAGAQPALVLVYEDSDASDATASGSMWFWASFLQYEIPQAYNVGVSAPVPVRSV